MSIENLWGEMPDVDAIRTPIAILKEQASLLKQKTNGLLEGTVQILEQELDQLIATLDIVAPVLGGYSVRIVQIKYGLHFYPVEVIDILANRGYNSNDEDSYKSNLETVFRSQHVQKIIKTLIQQVKSIDSS